MPNKCCVQTFYPDRVNIEQDSSSAGSQTTDYSGPEFKKGIPGRIITTSGDETFRGRQLEAHVSHVFECRWFNGVNPRMRLKVIGGIYKDRILNIVSVHPVQQPGKIPTQMIYCRELAEVQ